MCEYCQGLVGEPSLSKAFSWYSNIYWARHCQLAAEERTYGTLRDLFWFFLSNETDPSSPFATWSSRVPKLLDRGVEWDLKQKLLDVQAELASVVFLAGSFDFPEILETKQGAQIPLAKLTNSQGADILQVCTRCGSCKMMTYLLDQRGADIQITEEVVKAAARNKKRGKEVMTFLLDRRGADIEITQGVVKAAAVNWGTGKEVITLLLDRRGSDIPITEEIVRAASWNEQCGREITILLLDQRGANVQVAEEVVRAVAEKFDKDVMTLLLDRRGADIQVTEKMVEAVAGNKNGKEVMMLLLDRRGADAQITEGFVKLIAQNFDKEVMKLLLDRRGSDIRITEDFIKLIAQNFDKEIMKLLLDQRGADIQMTEDFVELVAQKFDKEVMKFLLDQRGMEIQVTTRVLEAAARNENNGREVMILLRGTDMQIAKYFVEFIVQKFDEEVISLLLDRRGVEIRVTAGAIEAAAGNWEEWQRSDDTITRPAGSGYRDYRRLR
jgi:DNA-binding protein